MASPCEALISEPDKTPTDQPGTCIPLELTYHPPNLQVKIITRNPQLLRVDPETAPIFKAAIAVIAAYVTRFPCQERSWW